VTNTQYKGGKISFDSQFQRSRVRWLHCNIPEEVRQSIPHGGRAWRKKAAHLMAARKQKGRVLREGARDKGTPPVTYFFQLGSPS
jgi:hypothetical protein